MRKGGCARECARGQPYAICAVAGSAGGNPVAEAAGAVEKGTGLDGVQSYVGAIVPLSCSVGESSLARGPSGTALCYECEMRGPRDHSPWERNPGLDYTHIHRDMDTRSRAEGSAVCGSLLCRVSAGWSNPLLLFSRPKTVFARVDG